MQRKFYTSLVEKIRSNPLLCKVVTILCKGLPWLVVAAYGVTLVVLLCTWNLKWIFFVIVPAVTVVLVTLLRNALNRPRPFERYGYTPLVSHGKGKSFPSRHTACAVVIGMACYYVWNPHVGFVGSRWCYTNDGRRASYHRCPCRSRHQRGLRIIGIRCVCAFV